MIKTDEIQSCECLDISQLPDDVKCQLDILNNSQSLIMTIIAGILLRYKSMDVQKQQLICSTLCPDDFNPECGPDVLQMQVVSSLIILYALFEFYNQSQCLLQQACENGTATAGQKLDLTLSEIIILVALIRFFQLVKVEEEAEGLPVEESPELVTEEIDLLEPDI